MTNWEYYTSPPIHNWEDMDRALKVFGADGWELVQIVCDMGMRCVFKRQVRDE
jgi:hypothetical protein